MISATTYETAPRTHRPRPRVAEACRLLRETADPITQIARASGFNNLSNFNRVFLRLKGVTPRAFRAAGKPGQ